MTKFFYSLGVCLLFFALFISCNEDPASVGLDLIPSSDKIEFKYFDTKDTPVFQKSTYYHYKSDLYYSNVRIIGKNSYTESVSLLKFNFVFADSILTQIKNNQLNIKKAWFNMRPTFSMGNLINFDFSVHQIRKNWNSTTFDKDSLINLNYDLANVSSAKTINDTLVNFNIQTSVINEWLKNKADSNSAPKNFGLLFKPTSGTQGFLGFVAARYTEHDYLPKLFVEIERPSVYTDTLVVSPVYDIHVVTGTIPNLQQAIYLQGGLSLRGTLFFDLSSLPKSIIINSAKLELTIDTLRSFDSKPRSDSIFVQALKDSVKKSFTSDSLISTLLVRKGSIFEGDVTWLIQKWITGYGNYSNHGVILSLVDENSTLTRLHIYGSKEADLAKRPRLKITYMQKK